VVASDADAIGRSAAAGRRVDTGREADGARSFRGRVSICKR